MSLDMQMWSVKAFFQLAYGAGLRAGEIASLHIKDIDSKSMRIYVRTGKGREDHYNVLSDECLCTLRECWSIYCPKPPEGWLFMDGCENKHITSGSL